MTREGHATARILVVDDDPGILRAVDRVLERRHKVVTAQSPLLALEILDEADPEVAILDIRMPEMNGFELMHKLRELRPELDVIMMTGSAAEPDTHLVRAIDEGAFYFIQKPFDRRVLQTLVARCLDLRRLRKEKQRQMRRLERELHEARNFQLSMLPPRHSHFDGLSIAARYAACDELGGDFYDYVRADVGRVAVLVADVSGHGAHAAMMTGIVKSAFHASHAEGYEPCAVVQRVADNLRTFDPRRFVTLFCARLDLGTRACTYVSAGHPPAIVHAPGADARLLESTGPLISSGFCTLPWEQASTTLASNERMLLYTDGVTEAAGPQGMFGRERLQALMEEEDARGGAMLDEITGALDTFAEHRPARDDMTLVMVDWPDDRTS